MKLKRLNFVSTLILSVLVSNLIVHNVNAIESWCMCAELSGPDCIISEGPCLRCTNGQCEGTFPPRSCGRCPGFPDPSASPTPCPPNLQNRFSAVNFNSVKNEAGSFLTIDNSEFSIFSIAGNELISFSASFTGGIMNTNSIELVDSALSVGKTSQILDDLSDIKVLDLKLFLSEDKGAVSSLRDIIFCASNSGASDCKSTSDASLDPLQLRLTTPKSLEDALRSVLFDLRDGDECPLPSISPSSTPQVSASISPIVSASSSPSFSPSRSASPSISVSASRSPSITPSQTPTSSPSHTPSISATASMSVTRTPSPSLSMSPSQANTPKPSISSTPSISATASISVSASISATPTSSLSPGASSSRTPLPSSTIGASATSSPKSSVSASTTPSISASISATPTASISVGASASASPESSVSPSHSPSASSTRAPSKPSASSTPKATPDNCTIENFTVLKETDRRFKQNSSDIAYFVGKEARLRSKLNAKKSEVNKLIKLASFIKKLGVDSWVITWNSNLEVYTCGQSQKICVRSQDNGLAKLYANFETLDKTFQKTWKNIVKLVGEKTGGNVNVNLRQRKANLQSRMVELKEELDGLKKQLESIPQCELPFSLVE